MCVRVARGPSRPQAVVKELDVGRMGSKERHQAALEVRLLSELSHPNIISYYGTVFNKRRQVLEIYMEYAEGGTLADLIQLKQNAGSGRGIEEQTVMRWTRQMLSALRCVHKRKIIHRDLKPSNVFITKDGAPRSARGRACTGLGPPAAGPCMEWRGAHPRSRFGRVP